MLETVGGNMKEREYSHGLCKKKTGYLIEVTQVDDSTDAFGNKDVLSSEENEDCFYSELSVADTGLVEMWMELRV